ncbi:pentapeptide repeat-containing protein [Streptomyces sp. NPDC006134]|uniref:pentapeptide repeat-containing protein n=1 Tax=Streptomyces sp. NPDC006134 TaxID=3154467 RepID=UPI00340BBDE0
MQHGGRARVATGGGPRGTAVKAARRPEARLPPLVPYGGGGLEPDGDYDGLEFREVDLAGQDGAGARFLDCALVGCVLDGTVLPRARLLDTVLTGARGVGTGLAEATLRDVDLRRVAALEVARGVDRLAGAVISPAQLMGLAPVPAAELGIRVEG